MNSSTLEEYLVHIHNIFMDGVALKMSTIVHQQNYGEIKIYDTEAEGFYVVYFAPMPYIIKN